MIGYKPLKNGNLAVYVHGRKVGTIKHTRMEYYYEPLAGAKYRSEKFESLKQLKESLEAE